MRAPLVNLIGVAALAVALVGCNRPTTESTSGPPGGPPPGAPPGPTATREQPASTDTSARAPGEVASDVTMTAKVKNALITSKVDTGRLNVDTKQGTVILRGSVPTAAQKSLAEKVAKQVAGVTTVTNQLTVAAKQ